MIKGGLKVRLTKESVLSLISEYDIFKYYMPNEWKLNRSCHSPFRKDSHPSFIIGDRYGKLYFIDFADSSKRGDCFEFVRALFNHPTIKETLQRIDVDFGLGIGEGVVKKDYKTNIVNTYEQPVIDDVKSYSLVQVVTRKFTNRELQYWSEYHQTEDDLRNNNVYAVKKVFLNRQLFNIAEKEMVFGYLYDRCWKIYRPLNPRESKWMPNNVPIITMDGKDDIKSNHTAIITKSKKDYMVLKKVFPHVCAVQNESVACFNEENVEHIRANSSRQILAFDSDRAGVMNSQKITKMFNFEYINVPKIYLNEGIKDFADLAKKHGLQSIEHYLKEKQLL